MTHTGLILKVFLPYRERQNPPESQDTIGYCNTKPLTVDRKGFNGSAGDVIGRIFTHDDKPLKGLNEVLPYNFQTYKIVAF